MPLSITLRLDKIRTMGSLFDGVTDLLLIEANNLSSKEH
jgi:hypothetical protein